MYKFELNDLKFLPHLGCEIELSLENGDGLVLMGPNGLGKTTLMRRFFENHHAHIPICYIQQEPLDFFFNRTIGQMKKILMNSRMQLMDTDFFNHCWTTFDLGQKEDRKPGALSGGEAQLLKICLGLGRKADIYLLDESSQALDPKRKGQLKELLWKLRKKGASVLMIEHDVAWLGQNWKIQTLGIEKGSLVKRESWTT